MRRRVKGLLRKIGLFAAFEEMPAGIRDQFFDCCYPDPVLVFDPSFPTPDAFGGAYAPIRAEVRTGFERATIDVTGFEMAVRDFYAVAWALSSMAKNSLAAINAPLKDGLRPSMAVRTFMEKAAGPLQDLCRPVVQDLTYTALHAAVVVPLLARSRLDGNLLHARLSMQETFRGHRLKMTLYAEKSQLKYARLRSGPGAVRGGTRPMHRVGTANVWHGIEWASWSRAVLTSEWADQIGMSAGDEWPVYVQGHALDRLRSRLDTYAHAAWAEYWMDQSLRHPKIVQRQPGGDLMVAFEADGKRLGYLVATVRDGMVAVRTFLFLTMRNTHEGRELARRLKLTGDEMEYLRLHELSRFTRTDLKDDPELRRIFKQCGCDHLFALAGDERAMVPNVRVASPFAAELKQYVGLAA